MKKLFLIIIGLCLCTALYADMNTYIIGSGAVSADECSGFLSCWNSENTLADGVAGTWTNSGADINYATDPAPLRGTYSAYITSGDILTSPTVTASEIWVHVIIERTAGSDGDWFTIQDSSSNILAGFYANNATQCTFFVAGGSSATTATLADDATVRMWLRYKQGTGSNAEFQVWIGSTATSRPGSSNYNWNDGTQSGAPGKLLFTASNSIAYVIDQVLIDDAEFTSVAE